MENEERDFLALAGKQTGSGQDDEVANFYLSRPYVHFRVFFASAARSISQRSRVRNGVLSLSREKEEEQDQ